MSKQDDEFYTDLQKQLDKDFPNEGLTLDNSMLKFQLQNRTKERDEARAELEKLKAVKPFGYVLTYLRDGYDWPELWSDEVYPDEGYALDAKDTIDLDDRDFITVMSIFPLEIDTPDAG